MDRRDFIKSLFAVPVLAGLAILPIEKKEKSPPRPVMISGCNFSGIGATPAIVITSEQVMVQGNRRS